MRDGEVDVWCVRPESVSTGAGLQRCRSLLTPDECRNVDRSAFPELRRDRIVSKAFVRTVLSTYADVSPAAWRFRRGPHGKPEIDSPACDRRWRFSISHTDGLIACLVGMEHEVGVDVECIDHACDGHVRDVLAIANRYFSPAESSSLRDLSERDQVRRCLELWTLKEAYSKARGLGLQIPLDAVAFDLDVEPGSGLKARFGPAASDDASRWQFTVKWLDGTHVMATATPQVVD